MHTHPLPFTARALLALTLGALGCTDAPRGSAPGASIVADDARACDIVIHTSARVRKVTSQVALVRFHQVPRALALSLASREDRPLGDGAFSIEWEGAERPDFSVAQVSCFDRLGGELPAARVSIP